MNRIIYILLVITVKSGSHMLPIYLRRSHRYCLGYFSDKWEHAPPATRAIAELYRWHACEVELKSTWRPGWLMLLATSALILQQYPWQYRRPCRRCISSIWEPGLKVYAGLSLCSRKQWCGTSTVCTGLLMKHLSVPPHQCGGGGVSINERWLYLQATVCMS